jgi:hypothetical protein
MTTNPVYILNPSLDTYENETVLRGVIDSASLADLKVDFYQRELLPALSRRNILTGFRSGHKIPDIVLGMRGENFAFEPGGNALLFDPVYIIDGQQRCRTASEHLEIEGARPVRLGATVHFNTSPLSERNQFQALNQWQLKVSARVILRNDKDKYAAVDLLYGLSCRDPSFVLYNRVCWEQNMRRQNLMSATTMMYALLRLHSHIVPGLMSSLGQAEDTSNVLIEKLGVSLVRQNVRALFELIDGCWGMRDIHFKGGAAYVKRGFIETIARLLSDHPVFWRDGTRLEVTAPWRRKLATFPISDPEIMRLAGATGAARTSLYLHFLVHLNSGKRAHRLVSRHPVPNFAAEDVVETAIERELELEDA